MKIIYEDNHILVVHKPVNISVQKDSSEKKDLLICLKEYLKQKYDKKGNVFLGLVHRLDRNVSGIMVFAKTSKAAKRLSEQIREHKFEKEYLAVVEGNLKPEKAQLIHYIKKDKKNKKAICYNNPAAKSKESILEYNVLKQKDNLTLVKINLITGRFHQIRAQFAFIGHPVFLDKKYSGKIYNKDGFLALYSYKISFFHPVKNQKISFKTDFPLFYPFNLFDEQAVLI